MTDYTIDKTTDIKLSFSITKNLYSTSIIEIELPNGVLVDTTTTCRLDFISSNINSNAYCEYLNNAVGTISKVTIKNAFTSSSSDYWATGLNDNSPTMEITFIINVIINPSSTKDAGTWKVTTKNYLSSSTTGGIGIEVETGTTSTSYKPSRGALYSTLTGLTSSSYQTSYQSAIYTFAIKFSNDVPLSGYLNFNFPNDFTLDTSSNCK
jgi:hypothetical protein